MLVLSRQLNETIVIGEGADLILITVVDIRGDKVRLGIAAPNEVPVHRQEIYEAILRDGGDLTRTPKTNTDKPGGGPGAAGAATSQARAGDEA